MNKLEITVDNNGKVRVFMDNYELKGVQAVNFQWDVGEYPTHEVKFVSHVARFD
jgi:hypothetical protein